MNVWPKRRIAKKVLVPYQFDNNVEQRRNKRCKEDDMMDEPEYEHVQYKRKKWIIDNSVGWSRKNARGHRRRKGLRNGERQRTWPNVLGGAVYIWSASITF